MAFDSRVRLPGRTTVGAPPRTTSADGRPTIAARGRRPYERLGKVPGRWRRDKCMMTPFSAAARCGRVAKSFILKLCWLGIIPLSSCHAARVPLPRREGPDERRRRWPSVVRQVGSESSGVEADGKTRGENLSRAGPISIRADRSRGVLNFAAPNASVARRPRTDRPKFFWILGGIRAQILSMPHLFARLSLE